MKRSCGNIDITNVHTVVPWVTECVFRHRDRYDFQNLIAKTMHTHKDSLPKDDYDFYKRASELITKEAVKRIKERDLQLPPVTYRERIDNSTFKKRLIGSESPMQQVFDYIAVRSCEEIWNRRLVPQQIAGIKDRGAIYGIGMIQKWVDKDNSALRYAHKHGLRYTSKCKYHTKLDVTQCYPSLRVDKFMRLFKRDCKNQDILWLWEQLLSSHAVGDYQGFMIGALCSQWACQYMISYIYRHLTEQASYRRGKRIRWVTHVAVQMDDILVFSSNRRNLKKAVFSAIAYAKEELGLTIKNNWQVQEFDKTPVDIVGYRIYRDGGLSVRDRVFLRARRLVLRIFRHGKITLPQARRLTAYKGYFLDNEKHRVSRKGKHSDSYKFTHKYKLQNLFRQAQKLVSRCEKEGINDGYCLLYGKA